MLWLSLLTLKRAKAFRCKSTCLLVATALRTHTASVLMVQSNDLNSSSLRLWVCGTRAVSAFQALARQIHSLPLVLPMLLPGLRDRGVGVRWSR